MRRLRGQWNLRLPRRSRVVQLHCSYVDEDQLFAWTAPKNHLVSTASAKPPFLGQRHAAYHASCQAKVIGSERGRVVLVTVDMLNHDREDAKVPGAEAT